MADVANKLDSWVTNPADGGGNLPTGATTVGTGMDDNLRQIQAVVRTLASTNTIATTTTGTVDLSTVNDMTVSVTGNSTITGLGTLTAGIEKWLRFAGTPVIVNSSALPLPGAANITAAAGDYMRVISKGSGNWDIPVYAKANGQAVSGAASSTAVGGVSRKAQMSVTTASASGTFTADEVIVETALGGSYLLLSNYSQAINLATTGAGGMDTGTAPISGYVSLYAIAKSDGTKNILACAVGTSSGSIYGGANMPAGYTYSALLGTIPTNGSSQFVAGLLIDRHWYGLGVRVVNNVGATATLTSQSISAAVPSNARKADVSVCSTAISAGQGMMASGDSTGNTAQFNFFLSGGANVANPLGTNFAGIATFENVPIITSQTIYWANAGGGTGNYVYVTGYEV